MWKLPGEYILENEDDSVNLATQIAGNIKPGDIVAFSGDLGAGKTFFCRQIIQALCTPGTKVISPTFNLLQVYEAKNCSIYHYDLYRLKEPHEIYELGFEEAINANICLIEWPEIIKALLPKDIISINIEVIDMTRRKLTLQIN